MFDEYANPLNADVNDFAKTQSPAPDVAERAVGSAVAQSSTQSEPMFTPDVIAAILRLEGGTTESIPSAAQQYVRGRLRIPGAPEIQDLKPTETRAIIGIMSFSAEADKDWTGFIARVLDNEDFEQKANNPFFPRWFGKTDEQPNPWMSDTGDIDGLNQKMIDQLCYTWQRPFLIGTQFTDMLKPAPISDPMIMDTIVDALTNFTSILLRPMGTDTGKNEEFRWSTTLPMLASLGYDAFRSLCTFIAQHTDEADFQHYSTIGDKELTKLLTDSVAISGYPINIGHIDCVDMIQALERCKLVQAPRWLPSLILLHVLKHVRYYRNLNGKKYLFAAYRGRSAFIRLPDDGAITPLGFGANKGAVLPLLENILRIKGGAGKKRTPCELAIAGVLNNIHPEQITKPIPANHRPDIIIAPCVAIKQSVPNQHESKRLWIDPGISVHNLGQFDEKTGEINALDSIKNELAMSLAWPLSDKSPDDLKEWIFELPPRVSPMRPSQVVFGWIKNVNPLGFQRGLQHIYDGIVIMDLIRHELFGTAIGSMATKEYPPVWALPMGSTMEETTNQGKTNFCRVTARIMIPGIDSTKCSLSTSPPAQRSSASQIDRFSAAFYDEFVMPRSPDHFLDASGFVSLCTGGIVNPGKAMENSEGCRLRHPMFLSAKTGPEVEDVKNRSFMIFLEQINDQNKCSEDELAAIFSGTASTVARLSTLLWIRKYDIVERVRALKPEFGCWRFNAHLAVIKMLAGDDYPEVQKYLEAMWKQCDAQREDVDGTNLMSEMGFRDKFDPKWYWDNASDQTMNEMWATCKNTGPMRLYDTMRKLIENGLERKFSNELLAKGTSEKGVHAALSRAITKKGKFERGPFEMTLVVMCAEGRQVVKGVLVKKRTQLTDN